MTPRQIAIHRAQLISRAAARGDGWVEAARGLLRIRTERAAIGWSRLEGVA